MPRLTPVGPSWPPGAAYPGPALSPPAAALTGWQPSLTTVIRSISSRGNHGRVRKSGSSTSSYTGTFRILFYQAVLDYQITYPKCYLIVTEDNFQTFKITPVFRVCFTISSVDHLRTTRHLYLICRVFIIFKIKSCFAFKKQNNKKQVKITLLRGIREILCVISFCPRNHGASGSK